MVLWLICGILGFVFVASWWHCLHDRNFESWKVYVIGKIALILLLVIFGVSKGLSFFVYNLEVKEVQIEVVAHFNSGSSEKTLAIVEVDGEKVAFEIAKNSDFKEGDKLKIHKKSSKFPVYDNWSNDWELHQ